MKTPLPRTPISIAFTALMALSAGVFYISHRAVSEWRRNAHAVATGRADAAANLLATALMRDMRAVQLRLRPSGVSGIDLASPRTARGGDQYPGEVSLSGYVLPRRYRTRAIRAVLRALRPLSVVDASGGALDAVAGRHLNGAGGGRQAGRARPS